MVLEQFCKEEAKHIVIYPPWSTTTQDSTPAVFYTPSTSIKVLSPEPPAQTETKMVDWVTPKQSGLCTVRPGQALKCGFGSTRTPLDSANGGSQSLSKKGVARWEQASMAIVRLDGQKTASELFRRKSGKPRYRHEHFHDSLDKQVSNFEDWTNSGTYHNIMEVLWHNPILFVLFVVLPAVYGGIHLTAWDFEFLSGIERLMWNIACFDIIITMVVIVGLIWMMSWFGEGPEGSSSIALLVFYFFLLVLFSLSRMFLVVESFISLRKIPIGVYWTPSWLQMIPHV